MSSSSRRPCIFLLFHPFPLQPSRASLQPPLLHPLQLTQDLVAIVRDLVGLVLVGPEALHAEAIVEVRAEVVHDRDWEHDVPFERGMLVGGEWRGMAGQQWELHSELRVC
jgi:hypothetical protein